MRRRRFFAAAVSGGLAAFAGCAYDQRRDPESGEPTDTDGGGSQTSTDEFVAALESGGIRVDSTLDSLGTVSLGYYHRPDHQRQDRLRVAETYAGHRSVSKPILSLTEIDPSGDSRHATYRIDHAWASDYASGDLSREAYFSKIQNTVTQQ